MNFRKLLNSEVGIIIISILLGFGLATLFRKVCNKRNCLVFEAPSFKELEETTYKFDDKCYKFKPKSSICTKNKKTVEIA